MFSVRIIAFSTPGTVSPKRQIVAEAQEERGAMRKMYFCVSSVMVSFQVSANTTGIRRSFATSLDVTPTDE